MLPTISVGCLWVGYIVNRYSGLITGKNILDHEIGALVRGYGIALVLCVVRISVSPKNVFSCMAFVAKAFFSFAKVQ